jgi:3-deoxy-D-manno-octulosonic-acid transferase
VEFELVKTKSTSKLFMIIYRLISILIFPFLIPYSYYRIKKGKEDKNHIKEKFGFSSSKRPNGDLIWLHAVSVGETNSVLILLEEILQNNSKINVLFTTTTLTSATILKKKIANYEGRVIHQFLPFDSYFIVKKFLNFWQPKIAIFVESEIWPNLIFEANKNNIKTVLVNGRMSDKSASRWQLARKIGFNIFDYFKIIFAQSLEDKKRLEKLNKNEVLFIGNLKSQARNLVVNFSELEKLKTQIVNRPIFLAASTHKGEEEFIIATHKELKTDFPDLLTILVPRHPNRCNEIKLLFGDLNFSRRSQNEDIKDNIEIYLADTLGELGTFYALADFAFVGGSLTKVGGHNPFEPIKLECAVISGSYVFNFKEIYDDLLEENACVILNSTTDLTDRVKEFLTDKKLSKTFTNKASQVIKNSENIAAEIVRTIYFIKTL